MTPLHFAATKGYCNIAKLLLRHGADINAQNWVGYTALHLAVSNNNIEIGRILIENNADLKLPESNGLLTTHLAIQCRRNDFLRLILDADPSIINVEDSSYQTALHLAISDGNIDCVRYLCDKGAKMTCQEFEHIAREWTDSKKIEMMKVLLAHLENEAKLPDFRDDTIWIHSITCDIIDLHSVECLSLLLQSDLPKYLVQAPRYSPDDSGCFDAVYNAPLAYLLNLDRSQSLTDEIIEAMLYLLMDHNIIFADEFFKISPLESYEYSIFMNIRVDRLRFFRQILSDRGVTADYAVQCSCNNEDLTVEHVNRHLSYYYLSQFSLSFDYADIELESLKFLIRNSCIVEPSLLSLWIIEDLVDSVYVDPAVKPEWDSSSYSVYNYLIALEPTYYLRGKEAQEDQGYLDLWEELSPVAGEFAKSSLKQLCRTVMRKLLRGKLANDDLMNFRRKIEELCLPTTLKNYLLYRD